MQQMTPGKLDHPTTHARIACFGKSSLASFLAALVRCPCQTSVPRHRSAVPQLARKNLLHQHVRTLNANPDHPSQQTDHPIASLCRPLLQSFGACRLDLLDLLLDEAQVGHVAPQLR